MQARKFESTHFSISFNVETTDIVFHKAPIFDLWKRYQQSMESVLAREIELVILEDERTIFWSRDEYIVNMNIFAHFVSKSRVLKKNEYQDLIRFHQDHVYTAAYLADPRIVEGIFKDALLCQVDQKLGVESDFELTAEMFATFEEFAEYGFISAVRRDNPAINPFLGTADNPDLENPDNMYPNLGLSANPVHSDLSGEMYTNSNSYGTSDSSSGTPRSLLLTNSESPPQIPQIPVNTLYAPVDPLYASVSHIGNSLFAETAIHPVPGPVITETMVITQEDWDNHPELHDINSKWIDVLGPEQYQQLVTAAISETPQQTLQQHGLFKSHEHIDKSRSRKTRNKHTDQEIIKAQELIKTVDEVANKYILAKQAEGLGDDKKTLRALIVQKLVKAKDLSMGFKCFLLNYFMLDATDGHLKGFSFTAELKLHAMKHIDFIQNQCHQYFEKRTRYYPNMNMIQLMNEMFTGIMQDPRGFYSKPEFLKDSHVMPFPKLPMKVSLMTNKELNEQKGMDYRIIRKCLNLAMKYIQDNALSSFKTKGLNLAHALDHLGRRSAKDISNDFLMIILEGVIRLGGSSLCEILTAGLSDKQKCYMQEAKERYCKTFRLPKDTLESIVKNIVQKISATPHESKAWSHWNEAYLTEGYVSNKKLSSYRRQLAELAVKPELEVDEQPRAFQFG